MHTGMVFLQAASPVLPPGDTTLPMNKQLWHSCAPIWPREFHALYSCALAPYPDGIKMFPMLLSSLELPLTLPTFMIRPETLAQTPSS